MEWNYQDLISNATIGIPGHDGRVPQSGVMAADIFEIHFLAEVKLMDYT